jgi:hypothetical protein
MRFSAITKLGGTAPDCDPLLFLIWAGSGMVVYDRVWPSFMTLIVARQRTA